MRKVPSNTFQGRAASGRVAGQGGLNSKGARWEPDEDTSRRLHGLPVLCRERAGAAERLSEARAMGQGC